MKALFIFFVIYEGKFSPEQSTKVILGTLPTNLPPPEQFF